MAGSGTGALFCGAVELPHITAGHCLQLYQLYYASVSDRMTDTPFELQFTILLHECNLFSIPFVLPGFFFAVIVLYIAMNFLFLCMSLHACEMLSRWWTSGQVLVV